MTDLTGLSDGTAYTGAGADGPRGLQRALLAGSPKAHAVAVGACLVLFYVVLVRPVGDPDLFGFGSLRDGRFNAYIVEHVYLWLTGADVSLFSPGFFFPYPDALFFSDNHLLNVVFYAPWRLLGATQPAAFTLWIWSGYLACAAAAYWVAWRVELPAAACAVAAIAFALALPALVHLPHAQLSFRFGVPLAFYFAWRGISGRDVVALAAAAFWGAIQFLASVYIGVFLALMVAVLMLHVAIRERSGLIGGLVADARDAWRKRRVRLILACLLAAAALGLAAANLAIYAAVSAGHNPNRAWAKVVGVLPHLESYVTQDGLPYWRWLLGERNVGEQSLFPGIGVAVFFVSGLIALARRPRTTPAIRFAASLGVALAATFIVTLYLGSASLWQFFHKLPGISAIRAPGRVMLVMAFPIAIIAAIGLRNVVDAFRPHAIGHAVAAVAVGIGVFELVSLDKFLFSWERSDKQVAVVVEKALRAKGGVDDPVLFVWPETGRSTLPLDVMWAGMKLGWPTLSGYSGYAPRGTHVDSCDALARVYATYARWAGLPVAATRDALLPRTVMVFRDDTPRRGLPSEAAAPKIRLVLRGTRKEDDAITADLTIENRWGELLPRATATPLRIAWRFVPAGLRPAPGVGWEGFAGISRNVPPCDTLKMAVTIPLPKVPGAYSLQMTLASAGRFLLHEKGMEILVVPDPVVVSGVGH